jgi:hypothetical protein
LLSSTVAVFTLTLFASATLLFLVEPMIAKMILPKFGGTPAVWNTCMVFFQAVLLAGYAYAHAVTTWLPPRRQTVVQIVLLALPILLLVLPIRVAESWAPEGDDYPVVWLLWLLVITIGLPFFVISTSAPLLSKWFADTGDPAAKDPYFLYAASNVGSMVSLFAYPVVFEPVFTLNAQSWLWAVGYVGLVAMTTWCARRVWRATALAPVMVPSEGVATTAVAEVEPEEEETGKVGIAVKKKKRKRRKGEKADDGEAITQKPAERITPPVDQLPAPALGDLEAQTRPSVWRYLYWIALAFVPSSMMLAVTTYLTTDIASIPLLWVIPLGLYLLSFILVFSQWDRFENWFWVTFMGGLLGRDGMRFFEPSLQKARALGMHGAMILAMPVVVLLLIFLMISDISVEWIGWAFLLHLSALFVVSMVCHGELARTRPSTEYLTGYYLCMSFGGVVGGMFNALAAPVIFRSVAEYPIVLVIACLLLPPLESSASASKVNFWIDIGLAVALGVGAGYAIGKFFFSESGAPRSEVSPTDAFGSAGLLCILGVLVSLIIYSSVSKRDRFGRWLDIALPVALAILSAQLFFRSPFRYWDLTVDLAESFGIGVKRMEKVLTYGLPIALCYGFAERPLRFGLGVGALFLAATLNSGLLQDYDLLRHKEYAYHGQLLGKNEFDHDEEGRYIPITRVVHQERSFFGVLKIEHQVPHNYFRLLHGTTLHGMQRHTAPRQELETAVGVLACPDAITAVANAYSGERALFDLRNEPLTYYHRTGPIGQVYETLCPPGTKCDVAFIGLGTGTMAAYLEPGQHGDFYEIDAAVVRLASDPKYFTYLSECRGKYDIRLGDARLKMREARDHSYRLIVVDAFSSDAIPVHLITKEALELYFQKLTPDGILAIHISNRHLLLGPVLGKIAQKLDKAALREWDNRGGGSGKNTSDWVVLANTPADLAALKKRDDRWLPVDVPAKQSLWTDDFSNIVGVLRWWEDK